MPFISRSALNRMERSQNRIGEMRRDEELTRELEHIMVRYSDHIKALSDIELNALFGFFRLLDETGGGLSSEYFRVFNKEATRRNDIDARVQLALPKAKK